MMESEILKAITHIKTVSKKKPDPVQVFNYFQHNHASNYEYKTIVEKLQEMIIDGVIDKNYRVINTIKDTENLSQEDTNSDVNADIESISTLLETTCRISEISQNLNTPEHKERNEHQNDNKEDSIANDAHEMNTPQSIESRCKYTSTDRYKYVELTTFDTFYEDYIEFKHYVDDILKTLNFNKSWIFNQ